MLITLELFGYVVGLCMLVTLVVDLVGWLIWIVCRFNSVGVLISFVAACIGFVCMVCVDYLLVIAGLVVGIAFDCCSCLLTFLLVIWVGLFVGGFCRCGFGCV